MWHLRWIHEKARWGGLARRLISKASTLLSLYCSHSFPVLTLLKGKLLNLQCAWHLTQINHKHPVFAACMPSSLTFMIHKKRPENGRLSCRALLFNDQLQLKWPSTQPTVCVWEVWGPDGNLTTSCTPPNENNQPAFWFQKLCRQKWQQSYNTFLGDFQAHFWLYEGPMTKCCQIYDWTHQ